MEDQVTLAMEALEEVLVELGFLKVAHQGMGMLEEQYRLEEWVWVLEVFRKF